jgi:hypothetical protein
VGDCFANSSLTDAYMIHIRYGFLGPADRRKGRTWTGQEGRMSDTDYVGHVFQRSQSFQSVLLFPCLHRIYSFLPPHYLASMSVWPSPVRETFSKFGRQSSCCDLASGRGLNRV